MSRAIIIAALSALWLIGSAHAQYDSSNSARSTTVKSSKSNTSDRTTTVKSSKSNTSDRKGANKQPGTQPWGTPGGRGY